MTGDLTARACIELAEQRFNRSELYYGHGTDSAGSDAFYLVMCAAGLAFDCDETELDKPLDNTTSEYIKRLIEQRVEKRIPVAYLVNRAWFAGHEFYIDQRVLIPRSPIAELINNHFQPWIKPEQVKRILDIGTGSGCIPIACAYAYPEASISAVDIDEAALQVAEINVLKHALQDRVSLFHSNLFAGLDAMNYDIIISNPPYVSDEEMQTLPEEYHHEPVLALAAKDQGLALVSRILEQASDYLNDDGILIVEVGNSRQSLIERYPDYPFTWLEFEQGGEGVFLLHKHELT